MTAVFRVLAALAGVLLAAFHLWLFGHQAWSGQHEYAESLRWLTAVGLVGGLIALWRQGTSLLWHRKATAVWVLAALLHGPALADEATLATRLLGEVPDAAVLLLGALATLGLALGAGRRAAAWRVRRGTLDRLFAPQLVALPASLAPGIGFLPRPPPRA
jgi:hypothetical protein